MNLNQQATDVLAIARRAGDAILTIYHQPSDLDIQQKSDDSPLTQADLASHRTIVAELKALTPDIPVLSEESDAVPFEQRRQWQQYWLVDPLDGTKEFINRNGEFTVNIALIDGHRPVFGVVHVPVKAETYWGIVGSGAFKQQGDAEPQPIQCRRVPDQGDLTIVASRRHGGDALEAMLDKLQARFPQVDKVSMGSSLKFCVLAEGKADWYPRLAPTSEWDTAAAQAVLEAAGGAVVDASFQPLSYNQKDDILNPHFHALADTGFDWRGIIAEQA